MYKSAERNEDMSPTGKLHIHQQYDGDIVITIIPDKDALDNKMASVEFCSIVSGGGRSPKTLIALRNLIIAMEDDNKERPIT